MRAKIFTLLLGYTDPGPGEGFGDDCEVAGVRGGGGRDRGGLNKSLCTLSLPTLAVLRPVGIYIYVYISKCIYTYKYIPIYIYIYMSIYIYMCKKPDLIYLHIPI